MTWEEIADGVFVRAYASFRLNVGLVVGAGACLVIDTRSHLDEAAELRRDLRRLTRRPIAAIVNTHWHFDHSFGNAAFAEAPVWAHPACHDLLATKGEARRDEIAAEAREAGWQAFADAIAATPIRPPDRTVTTDTTIAVGGRMVRLRYLGRGHTDNDLVVEVPDAGVLFAGDLIEEGAPVMVHDGYPLEWPDTLQRLGALVRGPVVPGHGAVVDAAVVTRQRDELATVADLARRVIGGELSEEAAISRSPLDAATTRTALQRARTTT